MLDIRGHRRRAAAAVGVLLGGALALAPVPVAASVATSPATGGEAIAATTAAAGGSGQYTPLSGPVIAEGAPGDVAAGTMLVDVPAGFGFAPLPVTVSDISGSTGPGAITLAAAPTACPTAGPTATVVPTTVQVAFTVCTPSVDTSHLATLQFSGLEVRPLTTAAGTSGQLLLDPASSPVAGVASLGTLTEVPGPTAALTLATSGTATAGTPLTVSVTTTDGVGNDTSGYAGTVTFRSSDPQAALPGDVTFTGQTTATATAVLRTAGTDNLTASDTVQPAIAGTTAVAVGPGPTSRLTVTGIASPTVAGTPAAASVTATDAFGNRTPGYTGTVSLQSSDSGAVVGPPYTFTAADGGIRSFGVTLVTAGIQSVTAVDVSSGISGTQSGIEVSPGPAHSLAVATWPTATVGIAAPVSVSARDAFGNTATGYAGTVRLATSDPGATVPGPYTFGPADAGTHLFTPGVVFGTTGTQTVSASDTADPAVAGTSSALTVAPGAAATMAVYASTPSTTAGAPLPITVAVFDSSGNLVTDYTGTVRLASTDPRAVMPPEYTFTTGPGGDNGSHTFTLALATAGEELVSAADVSPPPGQPAAGGTSDPITVTAGPAAQLTAGVSPSTAVAGGPVDVTVTALDGYGNVAVSFTGQVALSSSDPKATLPAPEPASGGVATFANAMLATAGPQSVTATAAGMSTTAEGILVLPGATAGFTLGGPVTTVAGASIQLTATAVDGFGNTVTGYAGTVQLSSTDPDAVLPPDYTFRAADAGTHVFTAGLQRVGSQTVTVADTAEPLVHGTSPPISVAPAPASRLILAAPTSAAAGTPATLSLTALDPYGNVASGYAGSVSFASSDPAAGLPNPYAFVPGASGDGGGHRFTVVLTAVGVQTVTATDIGNPSLSATSPGVTVTPGAAFALHLSGLPPTVPAEAPASVEVSVTDAYGNLVSSYTGTIHFTSSDPYATLPADYSFTGGGPGGDDGAHAFPFAVVFRSGGAQSITAQDRVDPTLSGSAAVTVALSGFLWAGTQNPDIGLGPVTLNGTTEYAPGSMNPVLIEDGRPQADGWSVTATLSDLTVPGYTDPNHTLAAGDVSWDPGANGGCRPYDATGLGVPASLQVGVASGPGGLNGPTTDGVALDPVTPASLCVAVPGSGIGDFVAQPTLQARVAPWKAAGVYQGTLTITVS